MTQSDQLVTAQAFATNHLTVRLTSIQTFTSHTCAFLVSINEYAIGYQKLEEHKKTNQLLIHESIGNWLAHSHSSLGWTH